jgi:hypothetical protein
MRLVVGLIVASVLVVPAPRSMAGATDSPATDRPVTVVAVVDGGGYSPYHFDFLGSRHPWNLDADGANDLDFTTDPASYIEGHPGATPIQLTLPTGSFERVDNRAAGVDKPAWDGLAGSTAEDVNVYWFPGTKIVGAVSFRGGDFYGDNEAHGTRSAASAAGNIHGTCPECVFVLVQGSSSEALAWAVSQPWIDVVTNSYGAGTYTKHDPARQDPTGRVPGAAVRDNITFDSPVDVTRAASEDGQVIVFSAGNGLVNAFDVPMFTYWSSQKGPDWMITVGAVSPQSKQTASGSGKPVDVSSIGSDYPSTGGFFANGAGTHSGTSNAAPVVGGYVAAAIQHAREVLGDTSSGHAGGVVASGTPVSCDGCPLDDGVLTRREVEDLVLYAARPSEPAVEVVTYPIIPTVGPSYYTQGHGVLAGRIDGADGYAAERAHIEGVLTGAAVQHARPAGEANWFVVDSKCRQRIWGAWPGGRYTGAEPAFDPVDDPLAIAFDAWCSQLPEDAASYVPR